jgi:hypothetical protein
VVGGKFGYQNLIDAVTTNFRWVWEKGVVAEPGSSDFVIGPLPLAAAALGLVALSRRAAGLFGLVALSAGLYGAFVLLYWHFEGRYFQMLIPWLYMLIAWGIVWLWDQLRGRIAPGGRRPWGLLVLPLAFAAFALTSVDALRSFLVYDTRPTSFTVAMDWLAANSTPQDVIMTRDPWELNWHSGRKAVMIPYEDLSTIKRIAQQYGVTMLQLGGPADGINVDECPAGPDLPDANYPVGSRPALGKLYCGYELPGFKRVYRNGDLVIYRVSAGP